MQSVVLMIAALVFLGGLDWRIVHILERKDVDMLILSFFIRPSSLWSFLCALPELALLFATLCLGLRSVGLASVQSLQNLIIHLFILRL